MSLPRKHNLDQLKRLRSLTKGKDIGDIVKKGEKRKESNMPNAYWIDNPLDRKIDTYESFIKKDNKLKTKPIMEEYTFDDQSFIIWQNYLMQNKEFVKNNYMNIDLIVRDIIDKNEYKEGIDDMSDDFYGLVDNYLNTEMVDESVYNRGVGPGNDDFFRNNVKQILTSQKGTNLLQIGKFVKVGKIEGYISSIDNDNVYISSTLGDNKLEKLSFKKFIKELSNDGKINENSGLHSEFWTDNSNEFNDEYGYQPSPNQYNPDVETEEYEEDEVIQPEREEEYEEEVIQPEVDDEYYEFDEDEFSFGTEDNPNDNRFVYENIYKNNFKTVKCSDCGEMVEDTYESKVAHIYNKHFNKPEMDGSVPSRVYSYDNTWPQGGKKTQELVKLYFPK